MIRIKTNLSMNRIVFLTLLFLPLLILAVNPASANSLDVVLWPDGSVPYKFDVGSNDGTYYTIPFSNYDKARVRVQMDIWQRALQIESPDGLSTSEYIRFWECTNDCPQTGYILVRYNKIRIDDNQPKERNNMCTYFEGSVEKVGRNPNGKTEFHITQGLDSQGRYANTNQEDRIILHELGHCLGVWHEFNRSDADSWLMETPDLDGNNFAMAFGTKSDLLPSLGNYDYDSIISYGSMADLEMITGFNDFFGNTIDKKQQGAVVSERDKSRVLQYYAHEKYPDWGFFRSLNTEPASLDALPNPYLAQGVWAVGTPTIAYQSPGNYDIFVRGSDNRLYWKIYRFVHGAPPFSFVGWRSIGCCFVSDPSALSRGEERLDVVAINERSEVMRIKYIDGTWYDPISIRNGPPSGGLKYATNGGYIGPAIASRNTNSLDVYVVRSDGLLSVSTWENDNWSRWRTLGANYNVTARPAAIALSPVEVQLAINERDINLYEPHLTYSPQGLEFILGDYKGRTAYQSPPALARRNGKTSRYRVLIVNSAGRISHRVEFDDWLDIGGIPKLGTGPSVVATGDFAFKIVMNGEDATGCSLSCSTNSPNPNGAIIQPGGLWIRELD